MATPAEVTVYCPRCDKAFTKPRKREAIYVMDEHVKLAHPDYYEAQRE